MRTGTGFGRLRSSVPPGGTVLLAGVLVLVGVGTGLGQSQLWGRGTFTLPADVTWDKIKLEQGTYNFRVEGREGTALTVIVTRGSKLENFVGYQQWVRGGQGLEPRLVLHVDEGQPPEVIHVEVPGPNFRIKFSCRHKKKKGAAEPQVASILFDSLQ
jgi:hypothetical protein